MKKHLKTVKTSIVLGILIISVFATIIPTVSSGLFLKLQSVITVTWSGNETEQPVIPRGPIRPVELEISYIVTKGALGKGVITAYKGKQALVKLEIVEHSEWVTAVLQTDTVPFPISEDVETKTNLVSFQVQENAPAYGLGFIKIRASIGKLGLISGFDQTFNLNFVPSYKPLIDHNLPETNSKEIGPMDTAVFPIEIENLGNARTIVILDVVDVPKNWNAVITSKVILEEREGATGTAYLVIRPPKDFGYHHEEKTIRVSMQPIRADDTTEKGDIFYERFLVQSRGFSTPGFELVLFLVAFLASVIMFKHKYKRKK